MCETLFFSQSGDFQHNFLLKRNISLSPENSFMMSDKLANIERVIF